MSDKFYYPLLTSVLLVSMGIILYLGVVADGKPQYIISNIHQIKPNVIRQLKPEPSINFILEPEKLVQGPRGLTGAEGKRGPEGPQGERGNTGPNGQVG